MGKEILGIKEVLSLRGLDISARIKLVRHQDKRYDIDELRRQGWLEFYQSTQSRRIFECELIVSFIGLEGTRARFWGVYRVLGSKLARDVSPPPGCPYPEFLSADGYYYELEKVGGFEALEDRIVIEWGSSSLAWHQWLRDNDKEVIEILPKGYVREFPGYLDFVLSYDELVGIISSPDANREWHRMLSAVAGVYLITDVKTGTQYVGSAYGEDGILGRWAVYARNPHGGDRRLEELLDGQPAYERNLRYTILQTLPRTLTQNEVIAYEALYKRKLGTRAFGLNLN
jgi:hypothetical protein